MSRQSMLVAVIAIVAVAGGMLAGRLLSTNGDSKDLGLTKATHIAPPRALPAFTLRDDTGAPITNENLRNRWTFLFFGFTNCPDICPQTLTLMAQVEKQLADLPAEKQPRVTLVSVDPKRDVPATLNKYVKYFNPDFTGITGTEDAIQDFTRALGVPVAITPLGNGGYTVDHSAALFLIGPDGGLHALFSTPHDASVIASDYRRLVAG